MCYNFVLRRQKVTTSLMEAKVAQKEIKFKEYDQNQVVRVPILIENQIPKNDLVRVVDRIIESIDMSKLESYYVGSGRPPYHPKMLLKVWVYGYCQKIYTSRPLSKALRSNLNFIWLSANQQPCFKTLSGFRSGKMSEFIDDVFKVLLETLVEEGYINIDDLYVDGSKWEANANQYKVVWKKNTLRHKENAIKRIEAFLEAVKELQRAEDTRYGEKDLEEVGEDKLFEVVISSKEIQASIERINELASQTPTKSVKKDLESLKGKIAKEQEKVKKYEAQEAILGSRNSYSKTDHDAVAMRMKDDRLRAAYNVQHSTNNQFVVNYTISQNASDNPTLIAHLEKAKERFEGITSTGEVKITADAGYGSEENYAYLEGGGMIAYVKYPLWFQERTGELAKKTFKRENWEHDKEKDIIICPNGRELLFKGNAIDISDNGYERHIRKYESSNCEGCPFATECKRSEDKNRTVSFSPKGEAFKAKAKELLDTEEGKQKRSNRSVEVETVFGDIKYNQGHDRFVLRGIDKVYVEYGLLAIAHNIRKIYCAESGIWQEYYAQRAAKKEKNAKKRV